MTEKEYGNPAIRSFSEYLSFAIRETGYFHIQATKPDTIGVGLTHSPLGLAAYILEKFSVATNRSWIDREDGGILEKFTMDELLDNIMVYWVTGSISSAGRLYREQMDLYKKHKLDRYKFLMQCFYQKRFYSCQFVSGLICKILIISISE